MHETPHKLLGVVLKGHVDLVKKSVDGIHLCLRRGAGRGDVVVLVWLAVRMDLGHGLSLFAEKCVEQRVGGRKGVVKADGVELGPFGVLVEHNGRPARRVDDVGALSDHAAA